MQTPRERTRHDSRSLRTLDPTWQVPQGNSPYVVAIESVTLVDPNTVLWRFSSPVGGGGNATQLTVNDGAGRWVSPAGIDAPDPYSINAVYVGVTLTLASMWRVLEQIDDFIFDDGLLIVPRSGLLTGP